MKSAYIRGSTNITSRFDIYNTVDALDTVSRTNIQDRDVLDSGLKKEQYEGLLELWLDELGLSYIKSRGHSPHTLKASQLIRSIRDIERKNPTACPPKSRIRASMYNKEVNYLVAHINTRQDDCPGDRESEWLINLHES